MSKTDALQAALTAADDRYIAALELALFVMKNRKLSKESKAQAIALLEDSLKTAKSGHIPVSQSRMLESPVH